MDCRGRRFEKLLHGGVGRCFHHVGAFKCAGSQVKAAAAKVVGRGDLAAQRWSVGVVGCHLRPLAARACPDTRVADQSGLLRAVGNQMSLLCKNGAASALSRLPGHLNARLAEPSLALWRNLLQRQGQIRLRRAAPPAVADAPEAARAAVFHDVQPVLLDTTFVAARWTEKND